MQFRLQVITRSAARGLLAHRASWTFSTRATGGLTAAFRPPEQQLTATAKMTRKESGAGIALRRRDANRLGVKEVDLRVLIKGGVVKINQAQIGLGLAPPATDH